jgi:hypothetical protein
VVALFAVSGSDPIDPIAQKPANSRTFPEWIASLPRVHERRRLNGGESGIRTHGRLPYTRFPSVRLRPLGHLSGCRRPAIPERERRRATAAGSLPRLGPRRYPPRAGRRADAVRPAPRRSWPGRGPTQAAGPSGPPRPGCPALGRSENLACTDPRSPLSGRSIGRAIAQPVIARVVTPRRPSSGDAMPPPGAQRRCTSLPISPGPRRSESPMSGGLDERRPLALLCFSCPPPHPASLGSIPDERSLIARRRCDRRFDHPTHPRIDAIDTSTPRPASSSFDVDASHGLPLRTDLRSRSDASPPSV